MHEQNPDHFYHRVCRILQESILQTDDLKTILRQVFGIPKQTGRPDSEEHAYQKVLEVLDRIEEIPPELLKQPSLADTVLLVLHQIQNEKVPQPHEPEDIELVGWLDLAMEDAEVMVITGMNDGKVPEVQTSDMFLPDKMRQKLDLEDNRRRYARDAYSLSCILETRQHDPNRVRLITGKRSAENNPMLPSRLFFAADDETVAKRLRRFFSEKQELIPDIDFGKPDTAQALTFPVPPPLPAGDELINKMNVTDFAAYKKCPYRFYLEKILRLQSINDHDEELNEGSFGECLHEVLRRFGSNEEMRMSRSADHIKKFLENEVRHEFQKFGTDPRPALMIQKERAISRLQAFAEWQAKWADEYDIERAEETYHAELNVDGKVMLLTGKIDRIDRRRGTDHLVILDYKTGAADLKNYRSKDGEWFDFQLPLYYYLLSQHKTYKNDFARDYPALPGLGYCHLPAKTADTCEVLAGWTKEDIDSAVESAREIVRAIWQRKFPPAELPPSGYDPFAAFFR